MNILQTLPMASRKPSTSSDALTPDENEEVKAISIVRIPYIFLNNDTNEADTAAEVMLVELPNHLSVYDISHTGASSV